MFLPMYVDSSDYNLQPKIDSMPSLYIEKCPRSLDETKKIKTNRLWQKWFLLKSIKISVSSLDWPILLLLLIFYVLPLVHLMKSTLVISSRSFCLASFISRQADFGNIFATDVNASCVQNERVWQVHDTHLPGSEQSWIVFLFPFMSYTHLSPFFLYLTLHETYQRLYPSLASPFFFLLDCRWNQHACILFLHYPYCQYQAYQ